MPVYGLPHQKTNIEMYAEGQGLSVSGFFMMTYNYWLQNCLYNPNKSLTDIERILINRKKETPTNHSESPDV